MAALKYRTFDGVDDLLTTTQGSLASQPAGTITVAFLIRLNSTANDAEFMHSPGYNPLDFYFTTFTKQARFFDGSTDITDGPAMDTSHGFVIVVMAKNTSGPAEWSYYRFDTNTWTHTTSAITAGSTGSFPSSGGFTHAGDPVISADFVCSAVWLGTKLSTTQRATLSTDFAAWEALSPTEAWTYGIATPGNAVVGTATQVSLVGSTLGGDSPLDEGGPQTWDGSSASVGVDAASGDFAPGGVTWTGSEAAAGLAGTSGAFDAGETTWSGSEAAVGVSGQSGSFTAGDAPQIWSGSAAVVGVAGTSSDFIPGAVTWEGSEAAIGMAGTSGSFTEGEAPQTWVGSAATVGVAGTSGTFVAGAVAWPGSEAAVGFAGISGSFFAAGAPQTWTGSEAAVGFIGLSGVFVDGGITRAIITCAVRGVGIVQIPLSGPALVAFAISGPALLRRLTGPATELVSASGPSSEAIPVSGPAVRRVVTGSAVESQPIVGSGPQKSRVLTGPSVCPGE